jgi:hypothetical protein
MDYQQKAEEHRRKAETVGGTSPSLSRGKQKVSESVERVQDNLRGT